MPCPGVGHPWRRRRGAGPRWLPRLAFVLVLLARAPAVAAEPRLRPEDVAARTPGAEEWRAPAVPLADYFSSAELAAWSEHRARQRWIDLLGLGLDLLIYLALLTAFGRWAYAASTRLAARLSLTRLFRRPSARGVARLLGRAFGADWGAALLFAALYFALGVVVDLPLSLLHERASRAAGLSTYTTALWITHFLKSLLLGVVLFSMLVFGLYGLIRRFPRRWWLLLAGPVALALVGYRVVAPYGSQLFHRAVPLEQAGLATPAELGRRLQGLAAARGIALTRITVIDASRTSRAINAYVTGMGPTRQLVLYDTLVRAASVEEIESVVAHELEHERREAPIRDVALTAAGLTLLLALLAAVLRRGSRRLALTGPGDIRTLPLIGVTVLLLFTLLLPVTNCRSRRDELLADRAALVLTGDPRAFIAMQVRLARANREEVQPSRWVEVWLYGHPPVAERIAQARWYASWLEERR
jgi:STE24 endopeptidase